MNNRRIEMEVIPGGVIVRSMYPDARRRGDVTILGVVCLFPLLLPAVGWLIARRTPLAWPTVIAASLFAAFLVLKLIRQFQAATRSYLVRADSTGLTIETTSGGRSDVRKIPRSQLHDIVLGFGGRNSAFRSWLTIKTQGLTSSELRCLHDAGGDDLARVADSLRAAVGLPKRSWP